MALKLKSATTITLAVLGIAGAAAAVAVTLMDAHSGAGMEDWEGVDDGEASIATLGDTLDIGIEPTETEASSMDPNDAASRSEVTSPPSLPPTKAVDSPKPPKNSPKETARPATGSGTGQPHPRGNAADAAANNGISWAMVGGATGFLFI